MHSVGTPQYQQKYHPKSDQTHPFHFKFPMTNSKKKEEEIKRGGGASVKVIMGSRFSGMWNEIYGFVLTNILELCSFLWPGQTFTGKTACEGVVTGQQLRTLRWTKLRKYITQTSVNIAKTSKEKNGTYSSSTQVHRHQKRLLLPGYQNLSLFGGDDNRFLYPN